MSDLHEMALELAAEKLAKISRLEVISERGRDLVTYFKEGSLDYDIQDEGRTLKLFIANQDKGDVQ